jgi:hypothetical protein
MLRKNYIFVGIERLLHIKHLQIYFNLNYMKKLFTTLLSCLAVLSASSQTTTVSPLPQKITWGEKAFANSEKFYLVGASQADADAVELLSAKLNIVGVSEKVDAKKFPQATPIIIGEANDKAIKKARNSYLHRPKAIILKLVQNKLLLPAVTTVAHIMQHRA